MVSLSSASVTPCDGLACFKKARVAPVAGAGLLLFFWAWLPLPVVALGPVGGVGAAEDAACFEADFVVGVWSLVDEEAVLSSFFFWRITGALGVAGASEFPPTFVSAGLSSFPLRLRPDLDDFSACAFGAVGVGGRSGACVEPAAVDDEVVSLPLDSLLLESPSDFLEPSCLAISCRAFLAADPLERPRSRFKMLATP